MANNSDKLIATEKAKRKELSRVRIFWFLIVFNIVLLIYLIVQIMLIVGH